MYWFLSIKTRAISTRVNRLRCAADTLAWMTFNALINQLSTNMHVVIKCARQDENTYTKKSLTYTCINIYFMQDKPSKLVINTKIAAHFFQSNSCFLSIMAHSEMQRQEWDKNRQYEVKILTPTMFWLCPQHHFQVTWIKTSERRNNIL